MTKKEIKKILLTEIKPIKTSVHGMSIEGYCVFCGYPVDRKLWNKKINNLVEAIYKKIK